MLKKNLGWIIRIHKSCHLASYQKSLNGGLYLIFFLQIRVFPAFEPLSPVKFPIDPVFVNQLMAKLLGLSDLAIPYLGNDYHGGMTRPFLRFFRPNISATENKNKKAAHHSQR